MRRVMSKLLYKADQPSSYRFTGRRSSCASGARSHCIVRASLDVKKALVCCSTVALVEGSRPVFQWARGSLVREKPVQRSGRCCVSLMIVSQLLLTERCLCVLRKPGEHDE